MRSEPDFQRGDVLRAPAPFKNQPAHRYFVVLSDADHPFHGEEYAVVALTSTERPEALALRDEDWRFGGPPGDSYASPWYCLTIKHADVGGAQGSLTERMTDRIATQTAAYLGC